MPIIIYFQNVSNSTVDEEIFDPEIEAKEAEIEQGFKNESNRDWGYPPSKMRLKIGVGTYN